MKKIMSWKSEKVFQSRGNNGVIELIGYGENSVITIRGY